MQASGNHERHIAACVYAVRVRVCVRVCVRSLCLPLLPAGPLRPKQIKMCRLQILGFDVEEVEGWADPEEAIPVDEEQNWELAQEGEWVPLQGRTYVVPVVPARLDCRLHYPSCMHACMTLLEGVQQYHQPR